MSTLLKLTEERDGEILTQANFDKYAQEIYEKFGFLAAREFHRIYGPQVGSVPKCPSVGSSQPQ